MVLHKVAAGQDRVGCAALIKCRWELFHMHFTYMPISQICSIFHCKQLAAVKCKCTTNPGILLQERGWEATEEPARDDQEHTQPVGTATSHPSGTLPRTWWPLGDKPPPQTCDAAGHAAQTGQRWGSAGYSLPCRLRSCRWCQLSPGQPPPLREQHSFTPGHGPHTPAPKTPLPPAPWSRTPSPPAQPTVPRC